MNKYNDIDMIESIALEYFKSFKFKTEFPIVISGNLIYLREHYNGYNLDNGDELDKEIENFLRDLFIETEKGYQATLLFEEHLDEAINRTKGTICKEINLHFSQKPSNEIIKKLHKKKDVTFHQKKIRLTFQTDNESSINIIIQNDYKVYVEENCLKLLNTFKRI